MLKIHAGLGVRSLRCRVASGLQLVADGSGAGCGRSGSVGAVTGQQTAEPADALGEGEWKGAAKEPDRVPLVEIDLRIQHAPWVDRQGACSGMVGVVLDLRHAGPSRLVGSADQRPDHKRGDKEHRGEDAQCDTRGPPVGEPAPQFDEHRHRGDQAEDAKERGTTGTCHERGPNQWSDVVQHVRCQADDPANTTAEHRPHRSTLPTGRSLGRGSSVALSLPSGGVRGGQSICGSHCPRLRSDSEGTMEKL